MRGSQTAGSRSLNRRTRVSERSLSRTGRRGASLEDALRRTWRVSLSR
jgi:hypothetical protein